MHSLKLFFAVLIALCTIAMSKPMRKPIRKRMNSTKDFGKLGNPQIIDIPVTFFFGQMQTALVASDQYLYYTLKLCEVAVQNSEQVSLYLSVPDNPTWVGLDVNGFVMIQVSKCPDSFVENCIIGQNYQWGAHIVAVPNITWNIGDETEYYIRILSGNLPTLFSMELSFVDNNEPFYYNWTTNLPFQGANIVNKDPTFMTQYWKSDIAYNIPNRNLDYVFAFGYCDEGRAIDGINVALTTAKERPFSLVEQWACPQSTPSEDCTQATARESGWLNSNVASFNLLQCKDDSQRSTADGIWVVVLGNGAEPDQTNTFYVQASLDVVGN